MMKYKYNLVILLLLLLVLVFSSCVSPGKEDLETKAEPATSLPVIFDGIDSGSDLDFSSQGGPSDDDNKVTENDADGSTEPSVYDPKEGSTEIQDNQAVGGF